MLVINEEQRNRRETQIVNGYKKRAKKGNSAFKKVVELTGDDGDYIIGYDDGEPPISSI